jgi:hypothetical protein
MNFMESHEMASIICRALPGGSTGAAKIMELADAMGVGTAWGVGLAGLRRSSEVSLQISSVRQMAVANS